MYANSNYVVSGSVPAHVNSDLNLRFFQYVDNDREFESGPRRDSRIWTDSNICSSCGDFRGHHGSEDDVIFHDEDHVVEFGKFRSEGAHFSHGNGHSSICHDNVANAQNDFKLTRRAKEAYVEIDGQIVNDVCHSLDNDRLIVFTKNARIGSEEKIAEALVELSQIEWDIIFHRSKM